MPLLDRLFGPQSKSTLISSAFSDVEAMLVQSQQMLEIALATLIDNEPLTADLDRMDDKVDQGERLVRRAVLQHLSVQPGQDLVASLVLVSIVQDCERIGDFARGLGDIAQLTEKKREGPFKERMAALRMRILPMFAETAHAFVQDEAVEAQRLVDSATATKAELTQYVRDVASSDLDADLAVVYSASARILSRVTSHLSNLCSTVNQPYDRMRHMDEGA